jgi:hypothetical protein
MNSGDWASVACDWTGKVDEAQDGGGVCGQQAGAGRGDVPPGVIGFYRGKSPEELRRSKTISDALTLGWLELSQRKAKTQEK